MTKDELVEVMAEEIRTEAIADYNGELTNAPHLAQAALDALKAQGFVVVQGWQDIASAPRDGTEVLISGPTHPVSTAFWSDSIWASVNNPTPNQGGGWIQEEHRSDTYVFTPTHWMPLPASPMDGRG
jgi:hypothetical protein